MKTVLLFSASVIAICATVGSARDFPDPEFSSILEDELLDIAEKHEKFLQTRRRRETDVDEEERSAAIGPPFEHDDVDDVPNGVQDIDGGQSHHKGGCRKHHKPSCCGDTPLTISLHHYFKTQSRSASNDCFEEVNAKLGNKTIEEDMDPYSCEKVKRMKKRFYCIHECAAKKLELANEEGALDFVKVQEFLLLRVNETWQSDLLKQATDFCSKIKYDESWKDEADEYKCNTQPLQFKHCVWKQVETNCPEAHQNTDRRCKKIRSKLTAEALGPDTTMTPSTQN
ncbi:Hypothetical protein NTJ_01471 [Nesidiocoris tenuis]|uniref:Uncharacterized protein n=1 Tax=Nesidiocoris tenuis TaxID=355587 RepID=A0ABN7ABY3_9HEMI|nr:Hypothetical protein NTJ_01471 [Nesidiocoris tenuis]